MTDHPSLDRRCGFSFPGGSMNELGLPPMNGVEWTVIFGAFFLFWIVPPVFTWTERLRERRAAAFARSAALQALVVEEVVSVSVEADSAAPEGLAIAAESVEIIAAVEEPVADEPAAAAAAPIPEPVADQPAGPTREFRLDDLRRARALETPGAEILADPVRQREWEEGLRLAEAHAADIGGAVLAAPFEPQARSFAGMRDRGEIKELHFLLYATLWPTAVDQAVGRAIFELGGDGAIVRSYVGRA